MVVFAVNSGGVAMITGDVTTLMIFMAGHVSMSQLLMLLLPAVLGVIVLALIFSVGMTGKVTTEVVSKTFTRVDVAIAVIFFGTILCTMLFNIWFNIPPVLTFLSGLSLMFLVGLATASDTEQTQILEYIRHIEFDTLLFFLGILLLVGMLQEIHVLASIADMYAAFDPRYSNYVMGSVSALIDNVPLTAALIKAQPVLSTSEWLALTYGVGVGGSLLVIGSASGIVMMSKVEGMTFGKYLRFFPALLMAYTVGYVTVLFLGKTFYGI
jgi:Na+/H+ antiporter NhaD/arsenite permease-like protein